MSRVNAWTQWGTLQEIVVGVVPEDACFGPIEPNYQPEINDEYVAKNTDWPAGPKRKETIRLANQELDNLSEILAGEVIKVNRTNKMNVNMERAADCMVSTVASAGDDKRCVKKLPAVVKRPNPPPCNSHVKTPIWSLNTQSGNACPRDVMITVGNVILEATMSKRARSFEWIQYRNIVNEWRRKDPFMLHKSAPTPMMADSSYDMSFWDLTDDERLKRQHDYKFVITEEEVFFDAADITRVGKDIFVSKSMVTNDAGIDWLRRELKGHVNVNGLHFPFDLHPSHIDCTFVPLLPPKGLNGTQGIALYNAERPPIESEMALWHNNNWRLVACPEPSHDDRPCWSQSSRWLSMNMLSLSEKCAVIEENELGMYNFLTDLGLDVVTVPFRNFFEFGGSIHCSTWDIARDDACVDYFPDRSEAYDGQKKFEDWYSRWDMKVTMPPNGHPYEAVRMVDNNNKAKEGADFARSQGSGFYVVEGDHTGTWSAGATTATEDVLRIDNMPVMESWEKPYMRRLADEVACVGGKLLEVGWGLALSGSRVQDYKHIVAEHHVIEGNATVFAQLKEFAAKENAKTDGTPKVVPHFGLWQDVVKDLKKKYGEAHFDSALYDTYPQDRATQHTHQFDFIKEFEPLLKPGGVITYCNLTSTGELATREGGNFDTVFDKYHRPLLKVAGFNHVAYPIKFKLSPETIKARGECEYYMHDICLVPLVYKEKEHKYSLKKDEEPMQKKAKTDA